MFLIIRHSFLCDCDEFLAQPFFVQFYLTVLSYFYPRINLSPRYGAGPFWSEREPENRRLRGSSSVNPTVCVN